MAIISYWYNWYNIKVRRWIFLETREAKMTVDSHHAIVNNFFFFKFIIIIYSHPIKIFTIDRAYN